MSMKIYLTHRGGEKEKRGRRGPSTSEKEIQQSPVRLTYYIHSSCRELHGLKILKKETGDKPSNITNRTSARRKGL